MKYKTTINITSEAKDKNEAIEIVEDYLAGNLRTGVDMHCSTRPECRSLKVACVVVFSLIIIGVILIPTQLKTSRSIVQNVSGISAVQAPLKTDKKDAEFKKKWEERQTKQAIEYIKQ
jgi:hypothetical protein